MVCMAAPAATQWPHPDPPRGQAPCIRPLPSCAVSYTYALIGLPPSERTLLESIFALDAEQGEDITQVSSAEEALLILINADDPAAIAEVKRRNPVALIVLVGEPPASFKTLPALRRPLNAAAAVRTLSRLQWPALERTPPPVRPAARRAISAPAPMTMPPPDSRQDAPDAPDAPDTALLAGDPASRQAAQRRARAEAEAARTAWQALTPDAEILLIARLGDRHHTFPRGLRRMGYRLQVLEDPHAALSAFSSRPYTFVFLDQASLGDELLPLIRAFSAWRSMPGMPPHVAVIARNGALLERVRARVAGCTAWMQIPIDRGLLASYFAKRGLMPKR